MHLLKVIKIQSLIRGAIARRHKIPHVKYTKQVAREVVEQLVENYVNETYIPDILLEILTMNKVTDDFGLYSPASQVLMQIRHNIITDVVRTEVESLAREFINRFID